MKFRELALHTTFNPQHLGILLDRSANTRLTELDLAGDETPDNKHRQVMNRDDLSRVGSEMKFGEWYT